MRCDEAQRALSERMDARLDGAVSAVVDQHVTGCRPCAAFEQSALRARRALRLRPADDVPDVAGAVLEQVRTLPAGGGGRRAWWATAAAVFLAGAISGSVLVGVTDPGGRTAAALAGRVLAAQHEVRTLEAEVVVVERGWHPEVPERRFQGRLVYEAPERFWLQLRDLTDYPSEAWAANDVTFVVDDDRRWSAGLRDCPSRAQPQCTPPGRRVHRLDGREPFEEAWPVPLELVTPITSFSPTGRPTELESRTVGGRPALGVVLTAAEVADVLAALRPAGNLRQVHPSDPVDLWLDEETMAPVGLTVRAGEGEERRRWAASQGYDDPAAEPIITVELRGLDVNTATVPPFPAPPTDAVVDDAGFVDDPTADGRESSPDLPASFRAHRSGTVGPSGHLPIRVATWTSGRAWLKVRSTDVWSGGRLFGHLEGLVRQVALGQGGIGYVSEDGRTVAVHGATVDLVVTGSLSTDQLVAVAAGLGVVGRPVPDDWDESTTADLQEGMAELGGLLVPGDREGFAPPAIRIERGRVTLALSGPGRRAAVLVLARGHRLNPPLDPAATAVRVRGSVGRWNPGRGEVEWVEDGIVVNLASRSMSRADLLELAERLEHR